ncbi:MAG: Veg family protein [Oscillospiraceae bacterium]
MFINNDLSKIKSRLSDNLGQKVKLTAKKGRKQIVTREGVIESIYPSIFIVKLDTKDEIFPSDRRVSYSYTDVLTRTVELIICEDELSEVSDVVKVDTVSEVITEDVAKEIC